MLNPGIPVLPVLREDLELVPGPRDRSGAPSWTVYDPVRSRYFRIGQVAFELLRHWHLEDWPCIAEAVGRATGRRPGDGERDWMVRFLHANMLIRREKPSDVAELETVGRAGRKSWLHGALHHYLFFRIPLVRPQRFLEATFPAVRLLMSKPAMVILLLMAVIGGYLALRQWDVYLATFMNFTNVEGLVWYGAALAFAKIFHELGHAYTAVRYGCRVPTMGIAFLVMWPVLYTDTSDTWRLTRRSRRLTVGAAGMAVELSLAVFATFLWSFLPDGPARSAAFVIATVTWVMTLAVNLSPFMRFDGYYLLSDILDVENLQDRAFSRARWWLRRLLFGFREPPPEVFPVRLGRILILYAFATWTYRFFLFLGIAALVYAFFFKLLGVILFAVEIAWFICLPIAREILEWWKRRAVLRFNANLAVTGLVLASGIGLMVFPWRTTVTVPAVLQAEERAQVYAPMAARIRSVDVERGDRVARGDILLQLDSPDLDHQIDQARLEISMVRLQVRREAAGGSEAENIRVLQRRLAGEIRALRGLEEEKALLAVRSPLGGRISDLDSSLREGLWVNDSRPLIRVVATGQAVLDGFADEGNLRWIAAGARAVFHPEDPAEPALPARVVSVADVNSRVLDVPYLASVYGGDVPVEKDRQHQLVPIRGIYRVSLVPDPPVDAPPMVRRGRVLVEGAPESLIVQAWHRMWGVLVRESGF